MFSFVSTSGFVGAHQVHVCTYYVRTYYVRTHYTRTYVMLMYIVRTTNSENSRQIHSGNNLLRQLKFSDLVFVRKYNASYKCYYCYRYYEILVLLIIHCENARNTCEVSILLRRVGVVAVASFRQHQQRCHNLTTDVCKSTRDVSWQESNFPCAALRWHIEEWVNNLKADTRASWHLSLQTIAIRVLLVNKVFINQSFTSTQRHDLCSISIGYSSL